MLEVHFGTLTMITVPTYNFSKPPVFSLSVSRDNWSWLQNFWPCLNRFNPNWANPPIYIYLYTFLCRHEYLTETIQIIHYSKQNTGFPSLIIWPYKMSVYKLITLQSAGCNVCATATGLQDYYITVITALHGYFYMVITRGPSLKGQNCKAATAG